MQAGDADQAMRLFQTAISLEPDAPQAYLDLAMAMQLQHRTADALAVYERLLAKLPDQVEALNNVAWIRATHPDASLRRRRMLFGLRNDFASWMGIKTPHCWIHSLPHGPKAVILTGPSTRLNKRLHWRRSGTIRHWPRNSANDVTSIARSNRTANIPEFSCIPSSGVFPSLMLFEVAFFAFLGVPIDKPATLFPSPKRERGKNR